MRRREGWAELARLISRDRATRKQKQAEYAETIGVSTRLLVDLETAARDNYSDATIHLIEVALAWAPGSVERIVNNQQPIDEPRFERLRAMWPSLSSDTRRMVIEFAEREFERG